MKLLIPLQTYNLTNSRLHWRKRAERMREQREAVGYALLSVKEWPQKPSADYPWLVTLTRISPRELDDDGVVSALKAVRDAFAEWVGVNDRHRHIVRYAYEQRKGKEQAVEIEVTPRQMELA